MKLLGLQVPFTAKPVELPPETTVQRFVRQAEELTQTWSEIRETRTDLRPWVNWEDREVIVSKYGAPIRVTGDS